MTWQITAKTGPRRGVCWSVGDRPVTIGRSLSCDIVVSDPTVSRRHCEIVTEGTQLRFRDLGSRNVALINGRLADDCFLDVGDELSLGTDSFIMSRAAESEEAHRVIQPARVDNTTMSLGTLMVRNQKSFDPSDGDYPATAQEMVRLYQLSRELHRTATTYEFANYCLLAIQEIFPPPATVHVCFQQPGQSLKVYPQDSSLSARSHTQVENALLSGRSILKFERKLSFRAASQIGVSILRAGGQPHAAFVVVSSVKNTVLEESDLARLDALASVAGLHLTSLLHQERTPARIELPEENESLEFLGKSEEAVALRAGIQAAARKRLNTVITGEMGTGKSLVAQLIHRQSELPRGALITVNCDAVSGPSFAAALLGEERANEGGGRIIEAGFLDQANGGTLVLDEIGALTTDNQRLLNRVLGHRAFARIGSAGDVPFHGRLIATTCSELETAVRNGLFRADLLKLISRIRLQIPPLRQRPADIRSLAQHFMRSEKRRATHGVSSMSEEALGYLEDLPLRGNASELHRTVVEAVQRGGKDKNDLDASADGKKKSTGSDSSSSMNPLEHAEHTLIAAVVRQCGGDMARAARILAIPRIEVERVARHVTGLSVD